MDNSEKIILSLYDLSGVWSQPYREAGYDVRQIDLQSNPEHDARLLRIQPKRAHGPVIEELVINPDKVVGIIAQPPCDDFAGSGARWWAESKTSLVSNGKDPWKGEDRLIQFLSLVDCVFRYVVICQPDFWVIENPVGRLVRFIGKPKMYYNPHEYAGWADNPEEEAYTKKTGLTGVFNIPEKNPVENTLGSKMHLLPPGEERKNQRSKTPQGFARAFFEANQP